jgi:SAM-dependent methyltransferase
VELDVSAFKERQRQMWRSGDYPDIARTIEDSATSLVDRVVISAGQDVLDVATGSGNAALAAAQAGAAVTGLDLTPELFEAARRRAGDAGVEVTWIEGDAEYLPFDDASFDRVLSVFGTMFAPRHEQAAAELLRVCRPGGIVGVCAWTPQGVNGQMFKTIAGYLPPPPPELRPPVLWGTEEHMRELLDGPGVSLEFERRVVRLEWESPEGWVDYAERVLGPAIAAKAALEPQGRWTELRGELVELFERANLSSDGRLETELEYLMTIARREG